MVIACANLDQDAFSGFNHAKTMSKNGIKNKMMKIGTNAIGISPGIFVIETKTILNESYDFLCKLGEGNKI